MKRVLLLGNSQLVIYKFRKELVTNLVQEGYEVFVSFPSGPFGEGEEISKKMGCHFIETPINRRGKNPIQDIKLFFHYIQILIKVKPDITLGYTVKPDIYGGIACRILKIPFIANITGLGSGLIQKGIIQKIMVLMYKYALKKAECVFFQNQGDKDFFEKEKITLENGVLIPGSGVNIDEYKALKYPHTSENIINLSYIARVMKAKGIDEYLGAAKILKPKYPNVIFNIFGYCEENYKEILASFEKDNYIVYHGLVDDIIEVHKNSHCTILPTYHPEGISNVLLESAACARPIITTNRIGCKETVIDGVSGYLVEEKNISDLVNKIEKFILLSGHEKEYMGIKGRMKIEHEFNRQIVVNEYMKVIEDICS